MVSLPPDASDISGPAFPASGMTAGPQAETSPQGWDAQGWDTQGRDAQDMGGGAPVQEGDGAAEGAAQALGGEAGRTREAFGGQGAEGAQAGPDQAGGGLEDPPSPQGQGPGQGQRPQGRIGPTAETIRPGADPRGFYADHYGFREHPFALMPDASLILWSRQYRRAFAVLEYGVVSGAPVTLLTGGIGCGKTTLVRELLARLDPAMTVGLISNAQGGRGELIQWVLNAIGQSFDRQAGYVALFQQLQDVLVAEYAAGRRVLLIFDEAQNLGPESLEELRMLTNINTGKDVVVQLLLVGQPELRALVRSPELEQLAQRIAVSYDLQPLDEATTREFILHRLKAAGGTGAEFDAAALAMIHRVTRGVPRLINQFCDISLLYGWTVDSRQITPDLLQQVLEDNIFFAVQDPPAAPLPGASPAPEDRLSPDAGS